MFENKNDVNDNDDGHFMLKRRNKGQYKNKSRSYVTAIINPY